MCCQTNVSRWRWRSLVVVMPMFKTQRRHDLASWQTRLAIGTREGEPSAQTKYLLPGHQHVGDDKMTTILSALCGRYAYSPTPETGLWHDWNMAPWKAEGKSTVTVSYTHLTLPTKRIV